jgi:N-acetylglucosaminyldiphosphoundecaprenol N-acetyl-beta-D-mannosaminyltransferase
MDMAGSGRCFFLGSTDETLHKIRERVAIDYPRIEIVGTLSPPFRPEFTDEDNRVMIETINAAKPDVLWIGLTAPKQEKWIFKHRDKLEVQFAGPIGAAFDFYAGNIKRISPFWGDLGLEWLPRLLQEPRRLWRRSIVSAPRFFLRTIKYRMTRRSN